MKRVIIILFALLPIFAAAQNEGSNDGLINKGSGILYFEGRPSFDPTPFTDASEFAIDLNTKKVYVYSGSGSVWNRYNAIDTLSTLADTANVDNRIGQLVYVNALDEFWTVNSAGSWEVLSSEAGITEPANPTHNTSLTFQNSKYYQPFTVTADTLTYTADTTSGVFGSYTVARVGFGDPGRPVIFDGTVFDTVQMYNIASGDSLSGVHMLYFEHTPYGVSVSVPTNSRTVVDTIEGGNSSSDPALLKSGGLALYTGLEGLTQVNDTLVRWIDQINQDTARNTTAAFEPAITGLGVNFSGDNHLEMITGFQFQDSICITAAFNVTDIPISVNCIVGQETDVVSFDLGYKRFDGGFTAFRDANVTTPTDTIAQNDMVVLQVSCASGSCEFWKNGVSIGSDTFTETLPQTYDILGAFNNTGGNTIKGTLYYLSVHRATYTSSEITDFFNYVNTQFSMGL